MMYINNSECIFDVNINSINNNQDIICLYLFCNNNYIWNNIYMEHQRRRNIQCCIYLRGLTSFNGCNLRKYYLTGLINR
jgi:hypothetical protein